MQASVVSDCTSERLPISWPKFDSTPQIAASMVRLTPYFSSARASARALPRHRRLAVGDPIVVHQPVDIVPDRRLELGLLLLEIEHLRIRLEPVEGDVERPGGNPAARGLRSQRADARGEVGARRGRECAQRGDNAEA